MTLRICLFLFLFTILSCKESNNTQEAILNTPDYLNDFTTFTNDSLVNIIIEIPAGTNQKWEVNKDTGIIEWERVNEDSLRVVRYLPYPANYGFIPQTYLPVSAGGDGDPLDVFLLGASEERSKVVPGRVIGIIKMLDKGEQDDKLIAVSKNSHFGSLRTLSELENTYPGVLEILTTWLIHYKGNNLTEIQSIEDEQSAMEVLNLAKEFYTKN